MSIPPWDRTLVLDADGIQRMLLSAAAITFVLASADLVFACTYWHQLYGMPLPRLLQNIAAGLLGEKAFANGEGSVLLGLLLHYVMMSAMVGVHYAVSRRLETLSRHPWLYGVPYGAVLYMVMEGIVVPPSQASKPPFVLSWIVLSIVVSLLIGLSMAQGAYRWARKS